MTSQAILDALDSGTADEDNIPMQPENDCVTILVLRELKSHAIFTTNGEDADLATLALANEDETLEYSAGTMFMRKQTGSDRRRGKEIQRDWLGVDDSMKVNEMNPESPESVLYGSAANNDSDASLSVTSRAWYDTAYSVRDAGTIIDEKFQNAPGGEYAKGPTPGIREPDFYEPGTLFPCTITLKDATAAEVLFVLAVTLMNKRYGASTSRLGRVKNHVIDIYVGEEEGPSNLELTEELIRRFSSDYGGLAGVVQAAALPVTDAKTHMQETYQDYVDELNVRTDRVPEDVREEMKATAKSDELKDILTDHQDVAKAFIEKPDE